MTPQQTDVLVIGGGPAGTTFATLMQNRGWNVVLLEKDHHPRFHVGESLLPMNLPIFERLGVLDEVRAIGVPKMGADFTLGNSGQEHQTFRFSEALGVPLIMPSKFAGLISTTCYSGIPGNRVWMRAKASR